MWPLSLEGRTYIAVRQHPAKGQLIKIGRSRNAPDRARSLGARIAASLLPDHCERELAVLLHEWRAWPRRSDEDGIVFRAWTEWYIDCPEVREQIFQYVESLQS